jgi:hypothetical protein
MKARTARRLASGLWTISVSSSVAATLLAITQQIPQLSDRVGSVALLTAFATFPTMGAVVASRRPNNAMGWLFLSIGVLAGLGVLGLAYSEYALGIRQERTALGVAAAWVATWTWYPTLGLITVFTVLLFPDGRVASRRWRPLLYLTAGALASITTLASLTGRLEGAGYTVTNPLGISGLSFVEETLLGSVLFGIFLACGLGAVLSLVVRFRQSHGDERQQMKWFVYASAVMVLIVASSNFVTYADIFFAAAIALPPIAMGMAILRYRLYDIDLIINRTLVYGVLTALLGLVYFGGVVGVGGLVREATGEKSNDLVIAASTLAVAALFRPARARVQRFIDRRFYRRKYNATRTLEAFSASIRDQVSLEALTANLQIVVQNTMQPTHVSVWLRR